MENQSGASRILRADALLNGAVGLLLMAGTWDALYNVLDLPHRGPALLAQLGGAGLVAFAYLLWIAPRSPDLARPIARAAAVANGLGAVIIVAWLIFRDKAHLGVGTQGIVELLVLAVVLAGLAVVQARIARAPGRPAGE
jgi:hypothetical protein